MIRSDIECRTDDGTMLRGWFCRPEGDGPFATIVMSHGFGSLKEQYLDRLGERFAEAGLASVIYDHRNFGASEGTPRHEINPFLQMQDMRHMITFASSLPQVDAGRIGLWGTSYSGGHALVVAAVDRRVKCVVAVVPLISGFENARRRVVPEAMAANLAAFAGERLSRLAGNPPTMVPVVSDDPAIPCALSGQESYRNFQETLKVAPDRPREVTLQSLEMLREYEPGFYVPRIAPTPLLMIVAREDTLAPPDLVLSAFETAREPKQLILESGGHYVFSRDKFDLASKAASDWYRQHLLT